MDGIKCYGSTNHILINSGFVCVIPMVVMTISECECQGEVTIYIHDDTLASCIYLTCAKPPLISL